MYYSILNKEINPGKTNYIINLTLDSNEELDKEKLLCMVDNPFGAPFGGLVEKHGDNLYKVIVYTD